MKNLINYNMKSIKALNLTIKIQRKEKKYKNQQQKYKIAKLKNKLNKKIYPIKAQLISQNRIFLKNKDNLMNIFLRKTRKIGLI